VVSAADRIEAAADRLIKDPRIDRSAVLMHLLGGLTAMSPVSRRSAADAVERAVTFAAVPVPAVTR
jgi:hypothetical protein